MPADSPLIDSQGDRFRDILNETTAASIEGGATGFGRDFGDTRPHPAGAGSDHGA
jgi:hypothetical protein